MDEQSRLRADVHTSRPTNAILHLSRGMQGQQHWSNYLLPLEGESRVTLPTPIQELVTILLSALQTAPATGDAIDAAVNLLVGQYREKAVEQAFNLAIKFGYIDADGSLQPAGIQHVKTANTVSARLKARASKERQRSIKVGTMFTSEYVRQDLHQTIADIKVEAASRKIIGVDMEVDAFYSER